MTGIGAINVGISLHSFNELFHSYEFSLDDCLSSVSDLGTGQGVEIAPSEMLRGYPDVTPEFARRFRRLCERYELIPVSLISYPDPSRPSGRLSTEAELIDLGLACLRSANTLGFPILRILAVERFYRPLLPFAERLKIKLGIELHAPISIEEGAAVTTPELNGPRIIEDVERYDSEYLGLIPDAGMFCRQPHDIWKRYYRQKGVPEGIVEEVVSLWRHRTPIETVQKEISRMGGDSRAQLMAAEAFLSFGTSRPETLLRIMHRIVDVHAKFFGVDNNGVDPAVMTEELVATLREGDYRGFITSEYEGNHWADSPDVLQQLRAHQGLIRRLLS